MKMSERKKFPTLKFSWTQPYPELNGYAWVDELDESDMMMIYLDMLEVEVENGKVDDAVKMLNDIGIKC
jgi:hypothetical protein